MREIVFVFMLFAMDAVILKKGREKAVLQRHHWIFSGAIESYPQGYQDGDLVKIQSSAGEILGWGFFNRAVSLAGRVVSFGSHDVYASLTNTIEQAIALRKSLLVDPETTACRLVNGEGDGLPGLIVDKYGPYLVIQTGALGMRKLLSFMNEQLTRLLGIEGIYDKSAGSSLKEEGIEPQDKILWGAVPDYVEIKEAGIRFKVDLKKGQKTGFFLDHRAMRQLIRGLSQDKRVLNGFCYTGGFTLAALKGGAAQVDSIDISGSALQLCKENVVLNGFQEDQAGFYEQNVFEFLQGYSCEYDIVILDPPAFAKKKKDIPNATKGYKKLFKLALQKMPVGSLLLASSCSYYISEELFLNILKESALEAKRSARIICSHLQAIDHPINLFHPESKYLKSLLIAI